MAISDLSNRVPRSIIFRASSARRVRASTRFQGTGVRFLSRKTTAASERAAVGTVAASLDEGQVGATETPAVGPSSMETPCLVRPSGVPTWELAVRAPSGRSVAGHVDAPVTGPTGAALLRAAVPIKVAPVAVAEEAMVGPGLTLPGPGTATRHVVGAVEP